MKRRVEEGLGEEHLARVRNICTALPNVTEKLSHGEPTFFVNGRVFTMFLDNHHNDGHTAVWLPVEPGLQAALIKSAPRIYFRPPYVGVKGWVGIELDEIDEGDLAGHIAEAWQMIAEKSKKPTAKGRGKRQQKRDRQKLARVKLRKRKRV